MDGDRLERLEGLARSLDPPGLDRAALLDAARRYADEFLTKFPDLTGYVGNDDAAAALPSRVVREEPEDVDSILSSLWEAVDHVGVNEATGVVRNVEPYRSSSGRVSHAAIDAAGGSVGPGSGRTRHAVPSRHRVAERA